MKKVIRFGIAVLVILLAIILSIADDNTTSAVIQPMDMINATNSFDAKPLPEPPLTWVSGTVNQILVQPGEQFYVFMLMSDNGSSVILRIADAHTGASISSVSTDNLIYDLLKEAYLRRLNVQVGYRDFGNDPQSGTRKLVIDRVSLT